MNQSVAQPPTTVGTPSHRVLPLFQPSGFIHNPGFQRLQMGYDFLPDGGPYALVAPGAARDQLLQDLRVHPQARRQRFDRLALARHQQAFDVVGRCPPPLASSERGHQGRHKLRELRNTAFPESGIPPHAQLLHPGGIRSQELLNRVMLAGWGRTDSCGNGRLRPPMSHSDLPHWRQSRSLRSS